MKLNLGCGARTEKGWVNVDLLPLHGVDVVHDLDTRWPWDDESVDEIKSDNVFEHVDKPILFMMEMHRVLKKGGIATIIVPHFSDPMAFTDPTHKRFPTEWTFDYWIPGRPLYEYHNAFYGGVAFEHKSYHLDAGIQTFVFEKPYLDYQRRA